MLRSDDQLSRPLACATRLAIITALSLCAILLGIRLQGGMHFVATAVAAIHYPFELDFGEGVVLAQTKLLLAGQAYAAVGVLPPYVITNYPPVFHLVTAAASRLTGNMLATGRGLSLASCLLVAMLIALLVWRAADAAVARLPRALAALIAGVGSLSISYTANWGALMRVDMLAHVFSLTGVLLFVVGAARGNQMYWCVVPFVLALYTKQTALAAPVACVMVAALHRPASGVKLAGSLIGIGGAIFFGLNAITHGQFYFQVITANHNTYDWHRAAAFLLDDLKQRYPIELAIAAVATVSFVRSLGPRRGAPSTRDIDWTRQALGVYAMTALLMSLTVGKSGSEVNYLIELMEVVSICVGVALADGFLRPVSTTPQFRAALSACLLPALLLLSAGGVLRGPAVEWIEIPPVQQQRELARLRAMVHDADGPVLSEDLTLLALADKPVEFLPCDMAHLAEQHAWDERAFVGLIERRHYALIVLRFDAFHFSDSDNFTTAMLDAIRTHYALTDLAAGYCVYRPRSASS